MQPEIKVGIVSAEKLDLSFNTTYWSEETGFFVSGKQTFGISDSGKIVWNDTEYATLIFKSDLVGCNFEVSDVTIGINFHWERKETQTFTGNARIIVENSKLTLINELPVEDYLKSVISSEMSASANEEFLKTHAVISRSWVLAQIFKRDANGKTESSHVTDDEIVRWYDREDHLNFDVCADDHCQRYQGITRQTSPTVSAAIDATAGLVLTDDKGDICDARFSKCCGGVFEEFENCWEPVHHNYLVARRDSDEPLDFPDLRNEQNAREWILSSPEAYCNTDDKAILSQVLNNYDQETSDFYRWRVHYSQAELAHLIKRRTGIDFGGIKSLEALERGTSGRIIRLRITGTKRTMTIGKELEIRRSLSQSHLYSSAFVVETGEPDEQGLPTDFTLIGAGWGHGVGLCQIGAAVMSAKGISYDKILAHYFPGSKLSKAY